MLVQHRAHVAPLPVLRVGVAQEGCDVVGVGPPAGLLGGDLCLVAGLGRGDEIGRDQDVLAQQPSQRCTGGGAVNKA
jgi:hypothetical protein